MAIRFLWGMKIPITSNNYIAALVILTGAGAAKHDANQSLDAMATVAYALLVIIIGLSWQRGDPRRWWSVQTDVPTGAFRYRVLGRVVSSASV
jgi:hypothetical protein